MDGTPKILEVSRGFQRFSEFLRDFAEVFRGPLRISLSEALSPVAPTRVVP